VAREVAGIFAFCRRRFYRRSRSAATLPGMVRKLRIAVSVFFGLLTVALCVLWVRSYWWGECVFRANSEATTAIGWNAGHAYFVRLGPDGYAPSPEWHYLCEDATEDTTVGFSWEYPAFDDFESQGIVFVAATPFWAPALSLVALVVTPLCSYLFSLRILLIATMLVAFVLGLSVWAAG
jgi:hypothetical protein